MILADSSLKATILPEVLDKITASEIGNWDKQMNMEFLQDFLL